MKKNSGFIIWIIFLIFLAVCSFYNYSHPIKKSNGGKDIYAGRVMGVKEEYEYTDESNYVSKYILEFKSSDGEMLSTEVDADAAQKYKENDKINYYEDKGIYVITEEKVNTETKSGIWLAAFIIEIGVIIFLVVKMVKKE